MKTPTYSEALDQYGHSHPITRLCLLAQADTIQPYQSAHFSCRFLQRLGYNATIISSSDKGDFCCTAISGAGKTYPSDQTDLFGSADAVMILYRAAFLSCNLSYVSQSAVDGKWTAHLTKRKDLYRTVGEAQEMHHAILFAMLFMIERMETLGEIETSIKYPESTLGGEVVHGADKKPFVGLREPITIKPSLPDSSASPSSPGSSPTVTAKRMKAEIAREEARRELEAKAKLEEMRGDEVPMVRWV